MDGETPATPEVMETPPAAAPVSNAAEASTETFYFASIGRRFAALFLDGVLLALLSFPLSMMSSAPMMLEPASTTFDPSMFTGYFFGNFIAMILSAAYYTFFIGHFGQTPGKMIMKIKVVNYDGTMPSYASAFVRHLISILSGAVILLGYIWAFFNPKKQTWHDMVAKTYVVKA